MKCHVYITPTPLAPYQLTTLVDLPEGALDLTNADLVDTIEGAIAKPSLKKSAGLFKTFSIDGVREYKPGNPLPSPQWLTNDDTKNVFVGHHPISGSPNEFYWREFLASVFTRRWLDNKPWTTNASHLGYPQLALAQDDMLKIKFEVESNTADRKLLLLYKHLPSEWTIASRAGQAHLGISHPGLVNTDPSSFITTLQGSANLLSARTHPLFYVALYQFWKYLNEQPLWSHLCPAVLVQGCRNNSRFDDQDLLGLGLTASTYRWGWWLLMSHLFAPRSRALNILAQYEPECYHDGQLVPRPTDLAIDPRSLEDIPRLRILDDPLE